MKSYPALDIRSTEVDVLYAALDDFTPTAIEELPDGLRAFFAVRRARDRALAVLSHRFDASPLDVPDEDWARKSQENLLPVTVGRITVVPGIDHATTVPGTDHGEAVPGTSITIVIQPSMGFGTGHHATTRLCLAALQAFDLSSKTFLDIGTGSGVLAIAANRLGARMATGVDVDPDAVQSARENLAVNPAASAVSFVEASLEAAPLPTADVVAANLTGALLVRSADLILSAAAPGGYVILSGLMREERDDVCSAFKGTTIMWEREEDEWIGLVVKKLTPPRETAAR
ncbi:MAG TPA: 50S ribosomal protein L11 methyltransferase [Vicinamibacterales bacterium]